jgi:hypothetical protein
VGSFLAIIGQKKVSVWATPVPDPLEHDSAGNTEIKSPELPASVFRLLGLMMGK